jgi:hypothetical protein
MTKLLSFFGNAWTLFTFAVLSFSLSVYVMTGLLVIWGLGFLIASIIRFFNIDKYGNVKPRGY